MTKNRSTPNDSKPIILVYVDHPMCSIDCADAVCDVLNQSGLYEVKMIGPDAFPKLAFNARNLKNAACLVMPGGNGDADQFDEDLFKHKAVIKNYVARGGKYLGICQGSYFAGKHYFDMLNGLDSVQYIKRKKASVKTSGPAVVNVTWKDKSTKKIYFHDGAAFVPTLPEYEADTIARYPNGDAAALIQSFKKGKVGVIGPHPEAQKWWFYSQPKIQTLWKTCIQHNLLTEFTNCLLN